MKRIRIKVNQKEVCRDMALPRYHSDYASGVDLLAAVQKKVVLYPGERQLIPTGIFVEIPPGFEAQIRPRSGLALKKGISLVNAPGTIDADYRGEIGVILVNLGHEPFTIERGDRIAQMIFQEVIRADFDEAEGLNETVRSAGGFGHTGV